MTTLTLLIDESWPATHAADWVLRGSRGVVVQQGRSEPVHWPNADRRVAILSGAQVSLCTIHLPKSRRQDRERLVAYALEERLPTETDRQHFTVLDFEGDRALVAIVDAARLRSIVDTCASVGHPLSEAYGRLQVLPRLAGTAVCVDEGAMRYWRWPDGSGLAEDLPQQGADGVSWAALKARQDVSVQRLLGPVSVAQSLDLPSVTEDEQRVLNWFWPIQAASLMHGQFAPRITDGSWRQRLRWPLWIAGGAVVLHLCVGVMSAILARQSETELNAKTRAIFAAAFPGATIVDPVLQMRRQLNEVRPKNGGLRDDDLLVLLAALSDSLAAESREAVARIRYEAGVLDVSLNSTVAPQDLQALIAALAMRGVSGQVSGGTGEGALTLRRSSP